MPHRFIYFIILFILFLPGCGPPRQDVHVILIGVDGMEWSVVNRLWEKGELPNLRRLADEGSYGLIASEQPSLSPCLWTTVASGRPRSEHGVTDFIFEDTYGKSRPINSSLVRAPRLWDILSAAGVTCGVVNWWATWPAKELKGFLVSDYFWPVFVREDRGWYVGSDENFDFPRRTYPGSLYAGLSELIVTDRELSAEEKRQIEQRLGCEDFKRYWFWPYCRDLTTWRVCRELVPRYRPRFLAVYFQGIDTMEHWFWPAIAEEGFRGIPGEQMRKYGKAIDGYYAYIDELLGYFLELELPNKVIILNSDHGFRAKNKDASRGPFWKLSDTEEHGPNGVLMLRGPMIEAGKRIPNATLYDIFPTVLYLMGMPLPGDIRGEIIREALKDSYLARRPPSYVASYGFLEVGDAMASPMDKHIIDSLKSIGYLQ